MNLRTAMKRLPTLMKSDADKSTIHSMNFGKQYKLPGALHRLPTLCATDYKSPYSEVGYREQKRKLSKPLRDTLKHTTGHRLTSAFAEWWMGWPIGLTALPPSETAKSPSKPP